MTHSDPHILNTWLRHIRALAEDIGPRGSTTDEERQASAYCRKVLSDFGLEPHVEVFRSATTLFGFHFTIATGMLISFFVYPLGGRVGAAIALLIAILCLISQGLELLFKNNPVRKLLPQAFSQNVIATVPPSGEHKQDLILMGHVDTNHCGLIFRSISMIKFWRLFSLIFFLTFYIQIVLYGIGLVTQMPQLWPWPMLPAAINALLFAGFMLEADLAPFSNGANDNATGAGLVLTLGEQIARAPLQNTRVWLACTGCEEVKHYGAADFYKRHLGDLVSPKAVVFEMLGRDDPAYLVRESTFNLFAFCASPELIALAVAVAGRHPELKAHSTQIDGGHSEMADALRVGVPAITIAGFDESGTRYDYAGPDLYWHHKEDTLDKMVPDVLDRNYAYVWAFVQAIDEQAAPQKLQAEGDGNRSGQIDPRAFFPPHVGLAQSRYPKSNRQGDQLVTDEQPSVSGLSKGKKEKK
ncbi:MAG: M28 family peptidase [Anaerolineae bacterium]|nr:M28 family peptidase [Anaerolineae bacterium]